MRPRHSDADLVELASAGSAPAFASLLHRHRDVVQRGALRAEHPQRTVEATMLAALRDVRRGRLPVGDPREHLARLVDTEVLRDPGRPGVERILPADWFDRAWVRVERRWPTGRRRVRPPRWAGYVAASLLLVAAGGVGTALVVTADVTTEVVSELVAEPIEDPQVLVVPGPQVEPEPEEVPELFGDVELGQLPGYDLSGEDDAPGPSAPTVGPPPASDPAAEDGDPDAAADEGADGGTGDGATGDGGVDPGTTDDAEGGEG